MLFRSRCSRSLRFVNADEHVERHPADLFEGALDVVDVMALDEVLDEFRICGQHHEPVAGGLGKQLAEQRIYLGTYDPLIAFDAAAYLRP